MGPETARLNVERAQRHLEFCIRLYRMHMRNGLYFLHEHPAAARSWKEEDVMRIANRRDVRTVVGDTCEFGMTMEDENGEI